MNKQDVLKQRARELRSRQTPWEQKLWYQLRRRNISGIRFLRQKAIGNYIVDFYAPAIKLAIELDGSQHFDETVAKYDRRRELELSQQGITLLRYSNLAVSNDFQVVLEEIWLKVEELKHPPGG